MAENYLAWKIWNLLNVRDRPITQVGLGPIPTTAIIKVCEVYDATLEDFEKVLDFERLMYKGPEGPGDKEQGSEKEFNPKQMAALQAHKAAKKNKLRSPVKRKRNGDRIQS